MVNYLQNYACCFIGHRKLELDFPKEYLFNVIKHLIVDIGVRKFLFGCNSEFNDLCHQIVTSFKQTYPDIVRINYPLASSAKIISKTKQDLEETLKKFYQHNIYICDYDEFVTPFESSKSGGYLYIKRNFEMVKNSDLIVAYLRNAKSKNNKTNRTTNSGTKLAVDFAINLKKDIIYI